MARTFFTGFDARDWYADTGSTSALGSAQSYETTIVRTGGASIKFAATSGVNGASGQLGTSGPYYRAYIRVTARPSNTARVIIGDASNLSVRLNPNGTLAYYRGSDLRGTSTAALTDTSKWYCVDFRANPTGAAGTLDLLRIDETVEITNSTNGTCQWLGTFGPGDTVADTYTIYIDDFSVDDTAFPGPGGVVLLLPVSIDSNSYWIGGGGGAASVNAVDNTPPIGKAASGDDDTTQIKTTSDNSNADIHFVTRTYLDAGVPSGSTVNAVQAIVAHGEEVRTGTKNGTFALIANPSWSGTSIAYGGDVDAEGTYPTYWQVSRGPVATGTPTLGTGVTIEVIRQATTRIASVCFVGAYVDYTPASGNNGSLTKALPLTLDAHASVDVDGVFSKALPLTLDADAHVGGNASLSKALPLTLDAHASVEVRGTFAKALPLTLDADGTTAQPAREGVFSHAVPLVLDAHTHIGGNATLAKVLPLSLDAHASAQVTASFAHALPLTLDGHASVQVDGALSKVLPLTLDAHTHIGGNASLSKVLPLTLDGHASVQVTASFAHALPLTLDGHASVQATGSFAHALPLTLDGHAHIGGNATFSHAVPLSLDAEGTSPVAGINASFVKVLPLSLAAAASVQVDGAFTKLLPLVLTAAAHVPYPERIGSFTHAVPLTLDAHAAVTVDGALSKVLPLVLDAHAHIGGNAALSKLLPLSLSAAASVQVTASFTKALPLSLSAQGAVTVLAVFSKVLPLVLDSHGTTSISQPQFPLASPTVALVMGTGVRTATVASDGTRTASVVASFAFRMVTVHETGVRTAVYTPYAGE